MADVYSECEVNLPDLVPLADLPKMFNVTYSTLIGYLTRWKIERIPDAVDSRVKYIRRDDTIKLLRMYRVYG